MSDEQIDKQRGLVPSTTYVLGLQPSKLVHRGIELVEQIQLQPNVSWRARDLHRALVSVCMLGVKKYVAEGRKDLPTLEIDEHFVLTFAAFASDVEKSGCTYLQNLKDYALVEPSTHCAWPDVIRPLIRQSEFLADTLAETTMTDWSTPDNRVKHMPSTNKTLAHFLRGLGIFVRWHSYRSRLAEEISETLASLDEFDLGHSSVTRAILCAINAAHVAGYVGGDFERYLLRNAVKDLALGNITRAIDGLDFLLHLQGFASAAYGGVPNPYSNRVNPKVLIYRTIASAFARDHDEVGHFWEMWPTDFKSEGNLETLSFIVGRC